MVRDHRKDPDRGVEHAAGRPADERETQRVPERAPEEVATGLLADGKKILATIAETSIPKLGAAQATEGDRRKPQQRRAEYDLAAEGIEVEFKAMRDKGKPGESRIAAYLRAAPILLHSLGPVTDALEPNGDYVCAPNIHTDGAYAWRRTLPTTSSAIT